MTIAASARPTNAGEERGAAAAATGPAPAESPATFDLFALGRAAAAARDAALGRRGSFARARQLMGDGSWRGPRDAAESYVEAVDLAALGGWEAAAERGAGLLVGGGSGEAQAPEREACRRAQAAGARLAWRIPFRAGEPGALRAARLDELRSLIARGAAASLWGVMPTPEGEPEGLDTLRWIAEIRLALPQVRHLLLDVAALGPRLAQMALGFGGDELWAPIVSERALRLGGNARNPSMTRKEAAALVRGADLAAHERLGPDEYSEEIAP